MLSLYPAIFYREKTGRFSVVFPDLNHLATCGEDINEAMEMAIDCLAGYIHSARLDGEILPAPTPIGEVDIHCEDDEDDDYESAFANIVAVDVDEYAAMHFEKPVKKTLLIPAWLDRKATELNINFSAVLKNRLIRTCTSQANEDISEPTSKVESNNFDKPSVLRNVPGLLKNFFSEKHPGSVLPAPALGISKVPSVALGAAAGGIISKGKASEKKVKKTLTVPKWLNARALAMNLNFSAVLKEGLLEACNSKLESK